MAAAQRNGSCPFRQYLLRKRFAVVCGGGGVHKQLVVATSVDTGHDRRRPRFFSGVGVVVVVATTEMVFEEGVG